MEVKEIVKNINDSNDAKKNSMVGALVEKLMCEVKETDKKKYQEFKSELYEAAYGQKLNEELASDWIMSMKPYGLKWNLEQTTNVLKEKNMSDISKIDFWAMMNAMYNDYFSIFEDDVEKYFQLAKEFIKDEDGAKNKVYFYWKYCTNYME
jgi:hypothetical protein